MKFSKGFSILSCALCIASFAASPVMAGNSESPQNVSAASRSQVATLPAEHMSSSSDIEAALDWLIPRTYKVTGDSVQIRTRPTTSSPSVGKLYKNDTVRVYSINKGWGKIRYGGQYRYVSATYLKEA